MVTKGETARILIIEDSDEVRSVLERMLRTQGYEVESAADGEQGHERALANKPDLVILDLGLPKRDGLEVARDLREHGFNAPLLMLTARNTTVDKVSGLDAGADDYLPKPFDQDELLARVKALLRGARLREGDLVLRVDGLTLDPIAREVRRDDELISVTQTEFSLLEFLMRNAGRQVRREEIMEQVWKQPFDPETNIVDVYINYLRKKIERGEKPKLLHTVRGVGYVLRA